MSDMYYIRSLERGYLGNALVWWSKGARGYTAYLENAERMTKDQAETIVMNGNGKYEMYPCSGIDSRTHIIFDSQDLKYIDGDKPEHDWPVFDARGVL